MELWSNWSIEHSKMSHQAMANANLSKERPRFSFSHEKIIIPGTQQDAANYEAKRDFHSGSNKMKKNGLFFFQNGIGGIYGIIYQVLCFFGQ